MFINLTSTKYAYEKLEYQLNNIVFDGDKLVKVKTFSYILTKKKENL